VTLRVAEATRRRFRVVVCGEKRVARECLEFLRRRPDTELCVVFTSPSDWQTDLAEWGKARRVRVLLGNVNQHLQEISALAPDFILSIQYRWRFNPPVLKVPARGCVNLHFSLLPRYAGCYPITWVLLNGERETGATLHRMTEQLDAGDILAQTRVPIPEGVTARDLFERVSDAAAELFRASYPELCTGALHARAQDPSQRLYHSRDSLRFKQDCILRWDRPGPEIQRAVRAFSFEPFQLPMTLVQLPDGRRLPATVEQTRLIPAEPRRPPMPPGRILETTGQGRVRVTTGSRHVVEIGRLDKKRPSRFFDSIACEPASAVFL